MTHTVDLSIAIDDVHRVLYTVHLTEDQIKRLEDEIYDLVNDYRSEIVGEA